MPSFRFCREEYHALFRLWQVNKSWSDRGRPHIHSTAPEAGPILTAEPPRQAPHTQRRNTKAGPTDTAEPPWQPHILGAIYEQRCRASERAAEKAAKTQERLDAQMRKSRGLVLGIKVDSKEELDATATCLLQDPQKNKQINKNKEDKQSATCKSRSSSNRTLAKASTE